VGSLGAGTGDVAVAAGESGAAGEVDGGPDHHERVEPVHGAKPRRTVLPEDAEGDLDGDCGEQQSARA
jgi:hypothetical protein